MTESAIQANIVKWLRERGWFVLVTSSNRKMPRQMRGLPDVLAWKGNVFLMVECKSPGCERRDSQVSFWEHVYPHLGPNVIYVLADAPIHVQAELYNRKLEDNES